MARKQIDWEAIHREYRAGQLSIREIGRQYNVTDGAIRKHAKLYKWQRDLSDRVRQKVKAELVRSEVRTSTREAVRTPEGDSEIVEQAAIRGVEVVRSHQDKISRVRR